MKIAFQIIVSITITPRTVRLRNTKQKITTMMPNPAATGAIQKPKQQKKLPTVQSRSELHFLRLSEKVDLLSKVFE